MGILNSSDAPTVYIHNILDYQHDPLNDLGRRAESPEEDKQLIFD